MLPSVITPVLKRYLWFLMASSALVTAGYLISSTLTFAAFMLVFWINIIGVFLVYRMNDIFAQHQNFQQNLRAFLAKPLNVLVLLQFIVIVIPLAILWLPNTVFYTMAIMGILGALYCMNFQIGKKRFRLKDFFLVKNLMIGGVWGALVLIGGAVTNDPLLMRFFFIAAAQVTIGGIIRDIPDVEHDRKIGVKTLPVVLGFGRTMRFLHFFNAALLFLAINYPIEPGLLFFSLMVVGWRSANLFFLGRHRKVAFFSQWMNLFTCVVFLIAIIILTYYGAL